MKRSAPQRSLFVDDQEATAPVDLAADVDLAASASPLGDVLQLLEGVRARTSDRTEATALTRIERGLRHRSLQLPVLPRVALAVDRLFDSPDCDMRVLAAEIELDPALATKIVGIANSPFYRGLGDIASVQDAVTRIGLRETRNATLAIALRSKLFRVPGFEADVKQLWQHSLAASISAQCLAVAADRDPDPAFLIGLIHDVGRTALLSLLGDLTSSLREVGPFDPRAFVERLPQDLHSLLGALVAESWRLPSEFIGAIAHHHRPGEAPAPSRPLAELIYAADVTAKRITGNAPDEPLPDAELEAAFGPLGLDREQVVEVEAEATEGYESLVRSL